MLTKVVDNFSYWNKTTWGKGSSWLTTYPGSPEQPWLKIQCGAKPGEPGGKQRVGGEQGNVADAQRKTQAS